MSPRSKVIRVGLIGYGVAFKMGTLHSDYMTQTDVLHPVAVCDVDPKCLREARRDFGEDILTFASADELLADDVVDMCVIYHTPQHPCEAGCAVPEGWQACCGRKAHVPYLQ